MKKILLLLCFILLCIYPMHNIFASTGIVIKPQTLLQGQVEIQELKKQETILQFQWSTFQLGNDSLGDIMKLDLTQENKDLLEVMIYLYVESKEKGEKDLEKLVASGGDVNEVQTELLKGKHLFYKQLIPYIQIEKLEAFKKYVDSDLNYNEKSKDIQVKIEQKNVEQNERVEELRDKIEDNSRNFRKKIEESITLQVSKKLDIFIAQESFSELPNTTKIEIFGNIIKKFESAVDNLEKSINPTRALEERVIGLEVVIEILESYIRNWN